MLDIMLVAGQTELGIKKGLRIKNTLHTFFDLLVKIEMINISRPRPVRSDNLSQYSRVKLCLLSVLLIMTFTGIAAGPAPAQERGSNISTLLREAENFYRVHRYEEALQRYEQFLKTSPPEQQGQHAWLRTAEIYGIKGDWNQARTRYERLLAVKTDSGIALRARYGVGQAHYKLGNHSEAERILENLSASSLPGDLRFKTNALLTELSLQSGNIAQGFSRLLLLEKDLPFGEEEWFQDLKTRLLSRATALDLEKFADLYRDTPLTAGVLLQLAKVELQAGRPERAEIWLTTLRQRFPQSPEAAQAKQVLPAPDKSKPAAPPSVVGCLLPLSGENADVGRQVKNGLELAASQSGVALVIKDGSNSSEQTAAAVEELANNPQVLVLVGFFPSATADAAAEAAQRLGIPLLALTQKKDVTLTRTFIFRDFLTHRLMVQALLDTRQTGWVGSVMPSFIPIPNTDRRYLVSSAPKPTGMQSGWWPRYPTPKAAGI